MSERASVCDSRNAEIPNLDLNDFTQVLEAA